MVDQWPATARQGDVIAVREGVTYLGLIPLPATDLGRDEQVVIRYDRPVLTFDSYLLKAQQPLPDDSPVWEAMADATAGWLVELGDVDEHGRFESFRRHMRAGQVRARWDGGERLLDVQYRNAAASMELGFSTAWQRSDLWHDPVDPADVIRYQRVDGRDWPALPSGVTLDNPLGQMGTAEVLRKGGASLRTAEERMALLRVEPIGGVTVGINPFSDPQPFELTAPGGMRVVSEGPLGLARVTIREPEGELHIDYAQPPASSRPSNDSAPPIPALQVTGADSLPRIFLNGQCLQTPPQRIETNSAPHYRIPLVP